MVVGSFQLEVGRCLFYYYLPLSCNSICLHLGNFVSFKIFMDQIWKLLINQRLEMHCRIGFFLDGDGEISHKFPTTSHVLLIPTFDRLPNCLPAPNGRHLPSTTFAHSQYPLPHPVVKWLVDWSPHLSLQIMFSHPSSLQISPIYVSKMLVFVAIKMSGRERGRWRISKWERGNVKEG